MRDKTMTRPRILLAALSPFLPSSCAPEAEAPLPNPFAELQGPYLGQTTPSLDPQPFAPELLSPYGNVAGVVAAPGGREIFFWTVGPGEEGGAPRVTMYFTEEQDWGWAAPQVPPFSGGFSDGYPAISPDGSRIYFQSDRPIDPAESEFQYNLWVADREGSWSEGLMLDSVMNSGGQVGSVTISPDGRYVFFVRITPRPDAPGETDWVVYWVDAAALAPVESPG